LADVIDRGNQGTFVGTRLKVLWMEHAMAFGSRGSTYGILHLVVFTKKWGGTASLSFGLAVSGRYPDFASKSCEVLNFFSFAWFVIVGITMKAMNQMHCHGRIEWIMFIVTGAISSL